MATKTNAFSLTINISDPASLGAAFQKLADEISITQSVCMTLAAPLIAILVERDIADGTADSLTFAGKHRQSLLDKIGEIRSKIGDSTLLTELENLCGRERLRSVD